MASTQCLEALNAAQRSCLVAEAPTRVFGPLLEALLALTESRYGFLDEVGPDEAGVMHVTQTLAISGAVSGGDRSDRSEANAGNEGDDRVEAGEGREGSAESRCEAPARRLEGVAETTLLSGRRCIINQPLGSQRARGLPAGHPPISALLGLPVWFGGEAVGFLGLANRRRGYDESVAACVEAVLLACGGVIHTRRLARVWREVERRLSAEVRGYAESLNVVPASVLVVAREGTVLVANETATRRYGEGRPTFLGTDFLAATPKEGAASRRQEFDRVLRTGRPSRFEEVRGGHLIESFVYPVLGAGGSVDRFVVCGSDVTAERQASATLALTNRRMRGVLEASLDSLVTVDSEGRIRDANAATEALTGLPRSRLVGTEFSSYFLEPERARAAYRRAFEHGLVRDCELSLRHPSGRRIWVLYNAALCGPEDAGDVQVVAAARDITVRRRMMEVLAARSRLMEYAATHSLSELLESAVDEAGALTDSPIGFLHFLDGDQRTLLPQAWSTQTRQKYCKAASRGHAQQISDAGVWADCVHQRVPVIHNDYASLPHRKGLPEGHAAVSREMVVPVLRAGRVVAILGVGNSPYDYVEDDVQIVSSLADLAWDIAERKRSQERLNEGEARYRRIVETSNEGIWMVDANFVLTFVNQRMAALLGYAVEELLGQALDCIIHEGDLAEHRREVEARKAGTSAQYERRLLRKDGTVLWALVSAVPHADPSGCFSGAFAMFTDITQLKNQQSRLEHLAQHDALTQLPNRVLLEDRMRLAMARALRSQTLLAVVYLDLDDFKPVNDSYGHAAGDRLLAEIARRLLTCVRAEDTVARVGGDEFVVLLGGLVSRDECDAALDRVLGAVSEAWVDGENGGRARPTTSAGVTLFPLDDSDTDLLLRHADQAMYWAKAAGGNLYRLFEPVPAEV